ncbi:MAG: PIN domain-containing protein, partial [Acidimicrobiia bacterium]
MPQRIVLDTSVLIADPLSMHAFHGCAVVIPLTVVEELDSLKTRMDDVGRAARTALRNVEELRRRAGGSLAEPTPLTDDPDSGTLHIEVNSVDRERLEHHGLDPAVPDNRIIGAALGQAKIAPTCLVSNDAALRIKAAHLGLTASEHFPVARTAADKATGWVTLEAEGGIVDSLYSTGAAPLADVPGAEGLYNNNFAVLRHGSQSALTRVQEDSLRLLDTNTPEAWGLRPRNKEQRFALELLLDPAI